MSKIDLGVPFTEIKESASKHYSYHGKDGLPMGACIHYTGGMADSDKNAIGTLKYMLAKRLGAEVVGPSGRFYVPNGYSRTTAYAHAGRSQFGRFKGLSRYLIGIEIACPGKLKKYKDHYLPYWVNINSNQFKKNPEKFYVSPQDMTLIEGDPVIKDGAYFKITNRQFEMVTERLLHEKKVNPNFSFDNVVGHEEIATMKDGSLGRKVDPGGSFPMSMKDYRKFLKMIHKDPYFNAPDHVTFFGEPKKF